MRTRERERDEGMSRSSQRKRKRERKSGAGRQAGKQAEINTMEALRSGRKYGIQQRSKTIKLSLNRR